MRDGNALGGAMTWQLIAAGVLWLVSAVTLGRGEVTHLAFALLWVTLCSHVPNFWLVWRMDQTVRTAHAEYHAEEPERYAFAEQPEGGEVS